MLRGGKQQLLLLFRVLEYDDGEFEEVEGQATRWVTAEELPTYAMPPADVPLVPAVQRELRALAHGEAGAEAGAAAEGSASEHGGGALASDFDVGDWSDFI